jgi:hypothetical protein
MRSIILLEVLIAILLFSCKENSKTKEPTGEVERGTFSQRVPPGIPEILTHSKEQYRDTRDVYIDSAGRQLIIENSLPKGGFKLTAPDGKKYIYTVFWTRITNKTDEPLELAMEFSEDFYSLPTDAGKSFKFIIPGDSMVYYKEPLFNYGLDPEIYVNTDFFEPASLNRIISPQKFRSFYMVTLFNKGVEGPLRTGLVISGKNLFYRVNGIEIPAGKINLKMAKLQS